MRVGIFIVKLEDTLANWSPDNRLDALKYFLNHKDSQDIDLAVFPAGYFQVNKNQNAQLQRRIVKLPIQPALAVGVDLDQKNRGRNLILKAEKNLDKATKRKGIKRELSVKFDKRAWVFYRGRKISDIGEYWPDGRINPPKQNRVFTLSGKNVCLLVCGDVSKDGGICLKYIPPANLHLDLAHYSLKREWKNLPELARRDNALVLVTQHLRNPPGTRWAYRAGARKIKEDAKKYLSFQKGQISAYLRIYKT